MWEARGVEGVGSRWEVRLGGKGKGGWGVERGIYLRGCIGGGRERWRGRRGDEGGWERWGRAWGWARGFREGLMPDG